MNDHDIWFLAHKDHFRPATLAQDGVLIGPYVFSKAQFAREALLNPCWPEEVRPVLIASSGKLSLFAQQLRCGLPPASPDVISFNAVPFSLHGGLYPVTRKGAEYIDQMQGCVFWTAMDSGTIYQHTMEAFLIALGEHLPN